MTDIFQFIGKIVAIVMIGAFALGLIASIVLPLLKDSNQTIRRGK